MTLPLTLYSGVLVDATSVPALDSNPLKEHWHGNVWVAPKGAVRNTRIWLNKTCTGSTVTTTLIALSSLHLLLRLFAPLSR